MGANLSCRFGELCASGVASVGIESAAWFRWDKRTSELCLLAIVSRLVTAELCRDFEKETTRLLLLCAPAYS